MTARICKSKQKDKCISRRMNASVQIVPRAIVARMTSCDQLKLKQAAPEIYFWTLEIATERYPEDFQLLLCTVTSHISFPPQESSELQTPLKSLQSAVR